MLKYWSSCLQQHDSRRAMSKSVRLLCVRVSYHVVIAASVRIICYAAKKCANEGHTGEYTHVVVCYLDALRLAFRHGKVTQQQTAQERPHKRCACVCYQDKCRAGQSPSLVALRAVKTSTFNIRTSSQSRKDWKSCGSCDKTTAMLCSALTPLRQCQHRRWNRSSRS